MNTNNNYVDDETTWTHRVKAVSANTSPRATLNNNLSKNNKTAFEQLLTNAAISNLHILYNIKGTILLTQHKYMQAAEAYSHTNIATRGLANPFVIHINDCHDCDYAMADSLASINKPVTYTGKQLALKLMELEMDTATQKGEALANTYFLLANAAYNLSIYGNSWAMTEYPFNPNWDYGYDSINVHGYYEDYYSTKLAAYYYKKAMATTHKKEFGAQLCFMLAKCEQNDYYISEFYSYNNEKDKKKYYREYFRLMKLNFGSTKFYAQAIKECEYFKDYKVE